MKNMKRKKNIAYKLQKTDIILQKEKRKKKSPLLPKKGIAYMFVYK